MDYEPVFAPDPVRAGVYHIVSYERQYHISPSHRQWKKHTAHWPLDGKTTERTICNTLRIALHYGQFYALRYYALPGEDLDTVAPA